ncbi:hypothetical protein A3A20_00555 [Candidatus Wolfebacteria bacterium RIFCSPLOWO2_01_FULL_45_19]|uniref:Serine aminopeptidase S33 domain-containing protein n=1 Tax=Candidatus Wolfebacteria bacterium RIFCSPLOWO2_01_FULL_45_19 TaxID=1802557 RepID=A0A1F8DR29_9BACT|nr:MAG: hypothetical protein UX23_C0006G0020 [Parcubacteria group bacterium GW2011_GWB1_45_9]OGM91071.1 MAG: hypothetical protein A3A20_00555 [Candidatus Wolfebacteria bacterium RIFCSPLOWO2_01_FULL_45_19]
MRKFLLPSRDSPLDARMKEWLRHFDTYDHRPAEPTIGTVVVLPGYRETMWDLASLLKRFEKAKFNIFVANLPNHGTSAVSKRMRGVITNFDECVAETRLLLDMIFRSESRGNKPVIFFGHSAGGIACIRLLQKKPFFRTRISGFIGLSVPFVVDHGIRSFLKPFVKYFLWLAVKLPRLPIDFLLFTKQRRGIHPEDMKDPLYYSGSLPIGFAAEVYKESISAREEIAKLNVPCLFVHGDKDITADFSGAVEAFSLIPHKDKTFIPLLGVGHERHEVFDESGIVERRILRWALRRIKKKQKEPRP